MSIRELPSTPLRVALAQTSAVPGDVAANAAAAARLIAAAAARGANVVVFPELALTGYELGRLSESDDAWITADDARLDPARDACVAGRLTAVLGGAMRGSDGTRAISAPIVAPDGGITLSRKEHVHPSEASLFQSGAACAPFVIAGWRVALGICFDAAHPAHAARAAAAGAHVYLVSALYERGEERRVDLHLGARAMDNRMFSALANYAGTTGGHVSIGQSGVWRPTGDVLSSAADAAPALLVVELDPGEIARWR